MDGGPPRTKPTRRRARDRLRFAVERLLLRGLPYRLALAALIVAVVAVVGGALIALFDPAVSNLGDAFWWAFLRLTDPGYLGDDEGFVRRSVSTVLTVLGYVLFLGLLIAILTQWLNQVIAKLESGVTPVVVSGHVLVLGWTHRTPTIVSELLRTRNRVQRFIERHGARELRIVILAEKVDDALARELRERLGELWNDRQVLLRAGSPLRVDHLERVGFQQAAAIILPGADHGETHPDYVDVQTIKTLMSVSKHASEAGAVPPLAVAELFDSRRAQVARRAYQGESVIVAADLIVSRLIAQSVRQRGLCSVFSELFTIDEGNTLYVRPPEDQIGKTFKDLRGMFPSAIPIGMVQSVDERLVLDTHPDTVVDPDDLLVFLSQRYDHCVPTEATRTSGSASHAQARRPALAKRRLLVVGWSRKVPALLREFESYGQGAFEIDVVSETPREAREKALDRDVNGTMSDRVRHIEASARVPGVLEHLEPERYDNIILVASERQAGEQEADASTVFSYLMLLGLLPEEGPRPDIFVELLDEENQFLFQNDPVDVIVSPLVVSYLLSQVALRRELAAIFSELSRPAGPQLMLRPASEYDLDPGQVRFEEIDRAVAAHGEVALGIRRTGEPGSGITLNPDRALEWSLAPDDEIVVLASFTDPASGD
jgi:hypothetical protein